jgi:autotransporter-associated beta strand protein
MASIRWLSVQIIAAVLAATPAWAQCTVTDTASLIHAIASTCATITLNNDVILTGNLPPIARDVTIGGAGHTLDGAGQFRGLEVLSGSVSIDDLTISGNVAKGGGGGAGLGGGLFVGTGATVTTTNVRLANNQAVGGNANPASAANGGNGLGGGIFVQSGGSLTAIGPLTLTGNTAVGGTGANGGDGLGGGLYVQTGGSLATNGPLTLNGNVATGGAGANDGGNGRGGGIDAQTGANVTIDGSVSLSGNKALGGMGASAPGANLGGGIFVGTGNIFLSPPASTDQNLADGIAGGGGITKAGLGMLTLSGTNTYTGATVVQQGVLNLAGNGSLGSGLVTVASGASLNLNVTKQSIAELDLSGALADALGGTGTGQFGKLRMSGNATIGGALDISLVRGFRLAAGDSFDIMGFDSLSGDFTGFAFEGISCIWTPAAPGGMADCGNGLTFSLSELPGSTTDPFYELEVTHSPSSPVPEPRMLILLSSGIAILVLAHRRRAAAKGS